MPPTGRAPSRPVEFMTLWVEDGIARLYAIETASGAIDEIARFSIEGMSRPQVLEIARQFVRARTPARRSGLLGGIVDVMTEDSAAAREAEPAAPVKRGPGRPRKDPSHGKSRYVPREEQMARQEALWQALLRHGDEGITAADLATELGRGATSKAAVPLGVLQRQGKAIKVDEKWYAVKNGNIPRHA